MKLFDMWTIILFLISIHIQKAVPSNLLGISKDLYKDATTLLNNDLSIYTFSIEKYDKKFLPEFGNGNIATQMKNQWIFVNGLYNGQTFNSHRACVPSTINWDFKTKDKVIHTMVQLDSLIGLTNEMRAYASYNITSTTYISRNLPQIMVRNISLDIRDPNKSVTLSVSGNQFKFDSPDINFRTSKVKTYFVAQGLTKIPENNYTSKLPIYVVTEVIPNSLVLSYSKSWVSFVTSIDIDLNRALSAFQNAMKTKPNLLYNHAKSWIDIWDDGIIQITKADTFLTQSIHAAQYYILSSMPTKGWAESYPGWTYYGTSPVGLAHGNTEDDYLGHVFWDMEMWIYPSVLPFHRDMVDEMVKYRLMMLNTAKQLSKNTGYKGSRYPWESARTGFETSPSKTCGDKEVHITADISYAIQQYLWLESKENISLYNKYGETIIRNIAEFWASRLSIDSSTSQIEILDVMPPDEYVHSCNNSAFTNIAAKLALEAPFYLAKRYGQNITSEIMLWFRLAQNLTFNINTTEKIILEHDTYKIGTTVKQADVVLLFYPFQINISNEYLTNSQIYYEKVTDNDGPAMTWAIYSINWFKLHNIQEAESLFQRNYGYINGPFYVWAEGVNGAGAVNFHTGMGGYLQNIVYGFMGMRVDFSGNGRIIFQPSKSTLIQEIVLHNIKFQNSNFDIKFDNQQILLTLLNNIPLNVFCTQNSKTYVLTQAKKNLVFTNQEIIITSGE